MASIEGAGATSSKEPGLAHFLGEAEERLRAVEGHLHAILETVRGPQPEKAAMLRDGTGVGEASLLERVQRVEHFSRSLLMLVQELQPKL